MSEPRSTTKGYVPVLRLTFIDKWTGKRGLEVAFWRWYVAVGFGVRPKAGRWHR